MSSFYEDLAAEIQNLEERLKVWADRDVRQDPQLTETKYRVVQGLMYAVSMLSFQAARLTPGTGLKSVHLARIPNGPERSVLLRALQVPVPAVERDHQQVMQRTAYIEQQVTGLRDMVGATSPQVPAPEVVR